MGLFLSLFGFYLAGVFCFLAAINAILYLKYGLRRDVFLDSLMLSLISWIGIIGLLNGELEIIDKKEGSNK